MKEYSLRNDLIIIITNQSGIAKKKFNLKDFKIYIKKLKEYLLKNNIVINKVYFVLTILKVMDFIKKIVNIENPR